MEIHRIDGRDIGKHAHRSFGGTSIEGQLRRHATVGCWHGCGIRGLGDGGGRCFRQGTDSPNLARTYRWHVLLEGWVDFLFMYYAHRWGTHAEIDPVTGEVLSRPEYLLLPATFGLWAMVMLLYIFCSRNACNFLNWWQTLFLGKNKRLIAARPMTRHTSIVTFMEINTMLWTCYLLLMNLYDPQLFGRESPVTFGVAFGALLSAPYVFRKQLHLPSWGANIRMGTATVIVFWIAVEAFNRTGIIGKLIAHPSEYPWHWVVMVIELCFLAGKIVKDARAKKEKK